MHNRETFVLTHNRFNTCMVLIFTDENEASIYKMPNRVSPHLEIEKLLSVNFLKKVKTNDTSSFLFETKKNYVHVGKNVFAFITRIRIVKYNSNLGMNDLKSPFAYGEENIMSQQKYFRITIFENKDIKSRR